MSKMTIRIADIVHESIVDGPGIRMVIFTQGCPHHCPGCHNPQTHDPHGGREFEVTEIIHMIKHSPMIDGITFSGGEPFDQPDAVAEIVRAARFYGKNVWCYTGYTLEEVLLDSDRRRLFTYINYLVEGRFDIKQRTLDLPWRGSKNQRIIDVKGTLISGKVVEWMETKEDEECRK